MLLFGTILAIGLSTSAVAVEPVVTIDDAGHVVARVVLPASASDVHDILSDTDGAMAELAPDVLDVTIESAGTCELVSRRTRGVFRPFAFRARRCPTRNGWKEVLVDSEDFLAYEAAWELEETAGGTEVIYRIQTELNSPVPQGVVRSSLKSAAGQILSGLAELVGRPRSR